MKKCIIVCAGEESGFNTPINEGDLVIAADAGLKYLEKEGIKPDIIVGDFDTLKYIPKGENVIKLNPVKDETDTFEAIRQGIKRGYKCFYILCGTGGKTEHTFANIQLLAYLEENGFRGYLTDKNGILTVIKNRTVCFDAGYKGNVSVFSLSDKSKGVTIKNLKYSLDNAELTNSFPLGISNEFLGKKSSITVKDGMLLLVLPEKSLM